MAMHAVHKILANASSQETVKPGEIVNCKVDIAGINDIYLQVLISFKDMGGVKVWDPSKVVFFFDHNAPSSTVEAAENQKAMRQFMKEQDINTLFDINTGVCHLVLSEAGMVKPGKIVVLTDSHSTTHGAFGAFGTGVGATDLATILLNGELWFRVPEVVNVKIEGKLKKDLMAKDIALHVLSKLGTYTAVYKVVEFSGEVVKEMSLEERMVLCNMAVEMGAKSAYIKPDEKTLEYLSKRTSESFTVYENDSDYEYDAEYCFNIDNLEPQVAVPFSPDNVKSIKELEGTPVDQVFIGACTGGKFTDLEIAASILKGRKIAPTTRLIVNPGSREILQRIMDKGYYQIFFDAGATIVNPGCGACYGGHLGLLAAGEKCVSTANRNFPGRMGSKESEVYLVSPITAAQTAIKGIITCSNS